MPGPAESTPQVSKVSDIISTFRPTRLFKAPGNSVYTSADFDNQGEFLLLARSDDTIHLYNCKAGGHAKELKSQKYGCSLARFTHHTTSIIYASTKVDDGIRYLSMHDNSFIRYFKGHTDRVTALCTSPSSDQFLSASMDNTIKLWDIRSPNPQGQLNFECPWLCAYDPSSSVIAVASPPAQTVVLYDLKNYDRPPFATFDLADMEKTLAPRTGQRPAEGWTGLDFSNTGKQILISTNGPGHYVIDAFTGELHHYTRRPSGADPSHTAPGDAMPLGLDHHTPSFIQASACFSPDGRYVVGGNGKDPGVLVWDVSEEPAQDLKERVLEPQFELPAAPSARPSKVVAYNPRHNLLATADKEMLMWLPDADAA